MWPQLLQIFTFYIFKQINDVHHKIIDNFKYHSDFIYWSDAFGCPVAFPVSTFYKTTLNCTHDCTFHITKYNSSLIDSCISINMAVWFIRFIGRYQVSTYLLNSTLLAFCLSNNNNSCRIVRFCFRSSKPSVALFLCPNMRLMAATFSKPWNTHFTAIRGICKHH